MFWLAGCGASHTQSGRPSADQSNPAGASNPADQSNSAGETAQSPPNGAPAPDNDDDAWRIRVITTAGDELWSFTEYELSSSLHPARIGTVAYVYSTINNWPTARFYAAEGHIIEEILLIAEALENMQTVTFRAEDGYEVSLTREQLLAPQYFFPHVSESDAGAAPVRPMIAYRWRAGANDLSEIRDEKPALIFGQTNPSQHTNPAFVIGVTEIVVDSAPSETWPVASAFPLPGPIPVGETVKLQHPSFGLVKLHYTLDGSDPTPLSSMYNPSTFQPELNLPIPIAEPTTIKVIVTGFGRNDSEIAVFEFWPAP